MPSVKQCRCNGSRFSGPALGSLPLLWTQLIPKHSLTPLWKAPITFFSPESVRRGCLNSQGAIQASWITLSVCLVFTSAVCPFSCQPVLLWLRNVKNHCFGECMASAKPLLCCTSWEHRQGQQQGFFSTINYWNLWEEGRAGSQSICTELSVLALVPCVFGQCLVSLDGSKYQPAISGSSGLSLTAVLPS